NSAWKARAVRSEGTEVMSDHPNQAKAIFLAAIDEHTPEQWPAFLDQTCAGDVPLRAEVERLLRAQPAMRSIHEAPPETLSATVEERRVACSGVRIGP